MSENADQLPESTGMGGENDVVAERSGADTPKARRPVPADPPEAQKEPEPEPEEEQDHAGDEIRPDIGPTGYSG
ncbi:hypothetical protein HII36_35835 [Nonomuraea sp. NN258]|uniref:hypothetical protein n=1 Tax=Nonomuraea antri TaxID=2730852 RepID=UPI001568190A|nr:hypothetical protein [Nonomuraea antri]NRQ37169.1 hypothetical protein [Nonomuraea antri]